MRSRPSASVVVAALSAVAFAGACNHAWDSFDPNGSSTSAGGSGGASSSSSTSASSGQATSSSSSGTSSSSGATTSSSSTSASSSGTGGGPPTHCGGANLVNDDFSGPQPFVWRYDDFQRSAGVGVLTLPAGSTDWTGGAIFSDRAYDLRGDEISMKVLNVPSAASGGWASLELDYDNGDYLLMETYQGDLTCGYGRGGQEHIPFKKPYDTAAHALWKIREDQGTIYCETSDDGVNWAPFGSFNLTASLLGQATAVHVKAVASVPPMQPSAEQFTIDDLHGGAGPAAWCPASSYNDDFTDAGAAPGPAWDRAWTWQPSDSFDQAGDQLNFHIGQSGSSGAGYQSTVAYDVTGQRVSVQVLAVPATDMTVAFFSLSNDDYHDFYWELGATSITCGWQGDNGDHELWSGALPALPVWLGIRESGGLMSCEIYENGAWHAYASLMTPIDPTAVDANMGVYTWSNTPIGPTQASFDGYNMGP